ncbi:phosphoglycerate mutase family protein [Aspergillus clavatus NRRL 1]|uniref:Phosphoglycerate mutase family protein n=1 Tax=Aspergillus clavatus (strain ATCC 1007 / CBS 513.65 / DSM 816 / NCTC 3887 / NRRL 1 / QM 1276 / 107) TaxID=344612 RepID=A1CT90_ASPCL|nr:phosphoglycerate mutase family protein [Aspergillus clavatus NRRL 1]EAW06527.1 phosphoglycerate mutase family protein [Aspergillus clavatus NRRL 1]
MSARVFLIRHGETEGTLGRKHISTSEATLSKLGEKQLERTRERYLGEGKLIDPKKISRIYITPVQQARRTAEILQLGLHEHRHFYDRTEKKTSTTATPPVTGDMADSTIQITPSLVEWKYGEYEGLTGDQIRELRKQQGLDKDRPWFIWQDGCPGGESPQQVSDRLDELIAEIQGVIQSTAAQWPGGNLVTHASDEPRDIVCVGPGHSLAALAMRWVGLPLEHGVRLVLEPASISILGFEDEDLSSPSIILGWRPV